MVVDVAEQLLGLASGEYELRNHGGNGFCWGSATLAGFTPGLVRNFNVEKEPFSGAGASSCAHDHNAPHDGLPYMECLGYSELIERDELVHPILSGIAELTLHMMS